MASFVGLVNQSLEENASALRELSLKIWSNPEISFKEYAAHNLLCEFFETHGFEVSRHYLVNTGFKAEFGSGQVAVAVICEYDALVDIGHGCGHNIIAEKGAAIALAVKTVLVRSSLSGRVLVVGTPAEEYGSAKADMLSAFEGAAAAIMAHPFGGQEGVLRSTTVCSSKATFTFNKCSENVSSTHIQVEECTSADAAVHAINAMALLRRNLNTMWRLSYIVSNITTSSTSITVNYRTDKGRDMADLWKVIKEVMESAARTMQCQMEVFSGNVALDQWSNAIMCERFLYHLQDKEMLLLGRTHDVSVRGSSDMGNVSQTLPSIQPFYKIHPLVQNHTREFTEHASSTHAERCALDCARAGALLAIDILTDHNLRKNIWDEFKKRRQREDL